MTDRRQFLIGAAASALGPTLAQAQGFAGLGTAAEGFLVPEPGRTFQFPADHGAHPGYRIEWWYLTANLQGTDGLEYGLQWTLFRSAQAPHEGAGWDSPQLWMGHAAVTTPTAHFVAERLGRGGIGQAGVTTAPFEAWIDEWALRGAADWTALQVAAQGTDFAYDMALTATGPLVFHGAGGFSVKSEAGQASYYYSQPFFEISGRLILPDRQVQVQGQAWLDREWSSQPLEDTQEGWDWFSLVFSDGTRLMAFQLRHTDGGHFRSGTWILPDGRTEALASEAIVIAPLETHFVAGRDVPVRWQVQVPAKGVLVEVSAVNRDAWMATSVPYWEGPVRVSGSGTGRGYLEMTGY